MTEETLRLNDPISKGVGYRVMRAILWAAVVAQVFACLFVAVEYTGGLLHGADDYFVIQAHKFPFSAKMSAALLTIGVVVSGACAVGMLKRRQWAPFPYIIWIGIAATENTFHRIDLLAFPFLAFPLSICILYCWALHVELRTAAVQAPPRAPTTTLQWTWLYLLAVVGCLPPLGAALSPFTFFAGVLSGRPAGRGLAIVSALGFVFTAAYFWTLAEAAFGPGQSA